MEGFSFFRELKIGCFVILSRCLAMCCKKLCPSGTGVGYPASNKHIKLCLQHSFSQPFWSVCGYSSNPSTGSKKSDPMLALFIIAVAVFIYMVYVLLKPEKF